MTPCPNLGRVDRHFTGGLGPVEEARMRSHLPECADCRARYRRRLMVERLDPAALGPQLRLARALGLRTQRRWMLWLAAPAMATAMALVLVFATGQGGFVARGGRGPAALEIYRAKGGAVEKSIHAGDELAFAYRNPAKKQRLLVFGVDEHAHVFWYHPAWVKLSDEPVAVAISADAALHELPEAIAQPLDGRELRISAWFLDEPLSVKRAETLLREGRVPDGAVVAQRALTVQ